MITALSVSLNAFLLANTIVHCEAIANVHLSDASQLSNGSAASNHRQNSRSSSSSHAIPDWKVGLLSNEQGQGQTAWWQNFGISSLWGGNLDMPSVSSSPAQDQQRCPIIKLPEQMVTGVSSNSWSSLQGGWSSPSGVQLATFDQPFLSLTPWALNISRRPVNFRAVSSGLLAVRTRAYSDAAMRYFYNWKPAITNEINAPSNFTSKSAITDEEPINIALLDCVGNLMYVARAATDYVVTIYDRAGSSVSSAVVEHPVVRMQFGYAPHDYLIATAESPNIGANITANSIPQDQMNAIGNVLPFGIKFAPYGYTNYSILMEPEFRWVIGVAVQAFAIYRGERDRIAWAAVTISWILLIAVLLLVCAAIFTIAFLIFRCVYPHHEDLLKDHHGKITENPFLAVPERPPRKDEQYGAGQSRQYAQQLGLHGKSMMRYGSLV